MTDIIRKCDRCGNYDRRVTNIWIGVQTSRNQSEVHHFCPKCAEELANWYDKAKEKTAP